MTAADRAKAAEVLGADDLRLAAEVAGAWAYTGSIPKAAEPIAAALAAARADERQRCAEELEQRADDLRYEDGPTAAIAAELRYMAARLRGLTTSSEEEQ